ncbi:hypothetical protein [Francisella frigiditurris]|uniref:Uncharacterized protein n=1 Tax=Francisella frigiditurris TaxID=1542390 RepID=A0A1J0KUJ0_9GAMM|nr:hypothetical protein [Francisella frigiditurris]APC97300.1 hypothetical protein KX01_1087 [Francisella frigiditurris]
MYNNKVKNLLSQLSKKDGIITVDQKLYKVEDSFSIIEMYVGKNISFRVWGDPYVVAMTKWLQGELKAKKVLSNIRLEELIGLFNIPDTKVRGAIQIMELIDKINER